MPEEQLAPSLEPKQVLQEASNKINRGLSAESGGVVDIVSGLTDIFRDRRINEKAKTAAAEHVLGFTSVEPQLEADLQVEIESRIIAAMGKSSVVEFQAALDVATRLNFPADRLQALIFPPARETLPDATVGTAAPNTLPSVETGKPRDERILEKHGLEDDERRKVESPLMCDHLLPLTSEFLGNILKQKFALIEGSTIAASWNPDKLNAIRPIAITTLQANFNGQQQPTEIFVIQQPQDAIKFGALALDGILHTAEFAFSDDELKDFSVQIDPLTGRGSLDTCMPGVLTTEGDGVINTEADFAAYTQLIASLVKGGDFSRSWTNQDGMPLFTDFNSDGFSVATPYGFPLSLKAKGMVAIQASFRYQEKNQPEKETVMLFVMPKDVAAAILYKGDPDAAQKLEIWMQGGRYITDTQPIIPALPAGAGEPQTAGVGTEEATPAVETQQAPSENTIVIPPDIQGSQLLEYTLSALESSGQSEARVVIDPQTLAGFLQESVASQFQGVEFQTPVTAIIALRNGIPVLTARGKIKKGRAAIEFNINLKNGANGLVIEGKPELEKNAVARLASLTGMDIDSQLDNLNTTLTEQTDKRIKPWETVRYEIVDGKVVLICKRKNSGESKEIYPAAMVEDLGSALQTRRDYSMLNSLKRLVGSPLARLATVALLLAPGGGAWSPPKPERVMPTVSTPAPEEAEKPKQKSTPAEIPVMTKAQQEIQIALKIIGDQLTFSTTYEGRNVNAPMPFAEYDPNHNFYTYPGSGRITLEEAKNTVRKAEKDGNLKKLITKNLSEYHRAEEQYEQAKLSNPGLENQKLQFMMKRFKPAKAFLWNEPDPYKRAFYESLRELGVFWDCSGTVFGIFDQLSKQKKAPGSFQSDLKKAFGYDGNVAGIMSANRWLDPRISKNMGIPPVKDFRPGDIIGLQDNEGKISHVIMVTGWEKGSDGNTYLRVIQATDELEDHGVFYYLINITSDTENLPIHKQEWKTQTGQNPKIAVQTSLGVGMGGQHFLSRLVNNNKKTTYVAVRPNFLQK